MQSSSSSLSDLMLQCAQEMCILPSCACCIIYGWHLLRTRISHRVVPCLGKFTLVELLTTSRIPKLECMMHFLLRASPDTCCSPFSFQVQLQLGCTRDVCGPTLPWCTTSTNSKALAITPFDDKASVASRALDSPEM